MNKKLALIRFSLGWLAVRLRSIRLRPGAAVPRGPWSGRNRCLFVLGLSAKVTTVESRCREGNPVKARELLVTHPRVDHPLKRVS